MHDSCSIWIALVETPFFNKDTNQTHSLKKRKTPINSLEMPPLYNVVTLHPLLNQQRGPNQSPQYKCYPWSFGDGHFAYARLKGELAGHITDIDAEAKSLIFWARSLLFRKSTWNMGPEGWRTFEIREVLERKIRSILGIVSLMLKAHQKRGYGI